MTAGHGVSRPFSLAWYDDPSSDGFTFGLIRELLRREIYGNWVVRSF